MSLTKSKSKAKEKSAKAEILKHIRRLQNADVIGARLCVVAAYNELLVAYCKYHSDEIGAEVAKADIARICGIKGDI